MIPIMPKIIMPAAETFATFSYSLGVGFLAMCIILMHLLARSMISKTSPYNIKIKLFNLTGFCLEFVLRESHTSKDNKNAY